MRKKLGLPSLFDMRFLPSTVALEFPKAHFVMPHFCAGYFREVLMLGDLCPNVHVDTSSSNSWIKYNAGLNGLKDVFARALEVYGARRILFGTDSSFLPRGWNASILETQVEILQQLGCGAEDARAILGRNLERLTETI